MTWYIYMFCIYILWYSSTYYLPSYLIVIKSSSVCCICVVFYLCIFVFCCCVVFYVVACAVLLVGSCIMTYVIFAALVVGFWVLLCNQLGFLPTWFGSVPMFWFSKVSFIQQKKKKSIVTSFVSVIGIMDLQQRKKYKAKKF